MKVQIVSLNEWHIYLMLFGRPSYIILQYPLRLSFMYEALRFTFFLGCIFLTAAAVSSLRSLLFALVSFSPLILIAKQAACPLPAVLIASYKKVGLSHHQIKF